MKINNQNQNDKTDEELRKIIMQHYLKPDNKGFKNVKNALIKELKSPTCSDEITLEYVYENNKFTHLKFEGTSCAISTSAADILINLILNQDLQTVWKVINNYEALLKNTSYDQNLIGDLIVFKNVYKQKNRLICATLALNGIKEIIGQ